MMEESSARRDHFPLSDSEQQPYILTPETPALLPLESMAQLFDWYQLNLCGKELIDPRGYRVHFLDTDLFT
jgi:hypothetical protein